MENIHPQNREHNHRQVNQNNNRQYNQRHHPHEVNEKILQIVKQSRLAIIGNYIVIVTFFLLAIYSLSKSAESLALQQFGMFFIATGVISLIYSEVKIHYKKLILTSRRAILHEGILKKQQITIRYSSITEVISKQNVYQRIMCYGNLIIRTSGVKREQDLIMNFISNPNKIKKIIEHFMIGGA